MAVTLMSGVVIFFLKSKKSLLDQSTDMIRDNAQLIEYHSAVESLKYAFFENEMKYYSELAKAGCETGQSFMSALKFGSGCSQPVKVFVSNPNDTNSDVTFKFHGGCLIKETQTLCGPDQVDMKNINAPVLFLSLEKGKASKNIAVINRNDFSFYLFSLSPEKGYLEFIALISSKDVNGKPFRPVKKSFAIRSLVSNFAHMEVDGRVTQEKPDPLARCNGSPWATYFVFNPDDLNCIPFAQLGGGTGLAYYDGRYFGFRPMDGQVIDLLSATLTNSYLVREDGTLNGDAVFPGYMKDNLINVDDITVIGESIYFVRNQGMTAHIGRYVPPPGDNEIICSLGELGWAQSYSGIASHSSSQDVSDLNEDAVATFYLKTDTGDFLLAYVSVDPSLPEDQRRQCFVVKDNQLQQIEYRRSLGFDRASDESRLIYY